MSSPVPTRISRQAFERLICPKGAEAASNFSKKYLLLWNVFQKKRWFLSWNWAAFFFGPLWFFYRRMYVYGIVLSGIIAFYEIAALVMTGLWANAFAAMWGGPFDFGPALILPFCIVMMPALILSLGSRALVALYANALYLNHAVWWRGRKPAAKGGVNLWLPIIAFVIFLSALFAFAYGAGLEELPYIGLFWLLGLNGIVWGVSALCGWIKRLLMRQQGR